MIETVKKFIVNRMNGWGLVALVLCVVALVIFGDAIFSRLAQIMFLVVKLAVAGFMGYWIHKAIFRDFRPAKLTGTQATMAYQFSRAAVVAAAMVGAGFAV